MRAVVHVNPSLSWQQRYGVAITSSLVDFGVEARTTHNPEESADLTVILGPHWAKHHHGHHRCLYIDRAYWGDPDAVSVHWMEHGEKEFDWSGNEGRPHPSLFPLKSGERTVVLCDYNKLFELPGATIRQHPSNHPPSETLSECFVRHEIAVGGRSTALVDAAIAGLRVISNDPYSPVKPLSFAIDPDREHWIKSLSWHNWTFEEIKSGELWPHFLK